MLLNGIDWTVIAGMGVSFVVAIVMQCGYGHLDPQKKMLVTIAITSVSWLAVTFLTKPTDEATWVRFKSAVRANGRDVGKGVLYTALSAFAIFFLMWAVGAVLFRCMG